jgi:predicted ArsR family transcriptional regulator
MKSYRIDKTGEAILEILHQDAKLTPQEIAQQLNITEEDVEKHIRKFEKDRSFWDTRPASTGSGSVRIPSMPSSR